MNHYCIQMEILRKDSFKTVDVTFIQLKSELMRLELK